MASSKQSTATALVLVFLIISLGGKEAEASGCVYLGPCKTNEECVPACAAKGYTSGALCAIDPSTMATHCCCIVP